MFITTKYNIYYRKSDRIYADSAAWKGTWEFLKGQSLVGFHRESWKFQRQNGHNFSPIQLGGPHVKLRFTSWYSLCREKDKLILLGNLV